VRHRVGHADALRVVRGPLGLSGLALHGVKVNQNALNQTFQLENLMYSPKGPNFVYDLVALRLAALLSGVC